MRFVFEDCVLDIGRHALTRAGQTQKTEPQVFDLIHLLIRHAGELVTYDQIIQEIWEGRAISDSALSARVAAARKVLGDDGKAQRIIQTVPRRGLQFVAALETEAAAPAPPPPAPQQPAPSASSAAPPPISYVANDLGELLAYSVSGSGTPVLLIAYQYTDIAADWAMDHERALFDAIAAEHTLVRFDPVGTGQSERNFTTLDLSRRAADAIAIADAAGLDRFALYSQSGGFATAAQIAATYPDRVTRLVAVGAYAEGRIKRGMVKGEDPIRGLIEQAWAQGETAFTTGYLTTYFPEGPLEIIRDHARLMMDACDADYILAMRDFNNEINLLPILPDIACKTLILHGRNDQVHPLSEARKIVAAIPDAALSVLDTANSLPILGNACWDSYLASLLEFLRDAPDESGN